MVCCTTMLLADVAAEFSAPLAPGGAVAFDSSGALLAVEAEGNRVLVIDTKTSSPVSVFAAGVAPISTLAMRAGGLVAVGALDGSIALHRVASGEVIRRMTTNTQALMALSFSPDGSLMAAGDDDGHLVVCRVSDGTELRHIKTGGPIRAIAIPDSGSPVLLGGPGGWLSVQYKVLPPLGFSGAGAAVTSLAFPVRSTGEPLAGRADGTIGRIDLGYQRLIPYIDTTGGESVRALWAGPRGQVKALTGNGELNIWGSHGGEPAILRRLPDSLRPAGEQLLDWAEELFRLLTAFSEVREQMRDDLAAGRAEMLDQLDGISDAERERIRPAVINSAVSIIDSYAFDLAVEKIITANPLPALTLVFGVLLALAILPFTPPGAALGHLNGGVQWVPFIGMFAGGILITWLLRRLGAAGRTLRALIVAAGFLLTLAGPQVELSEPVGMRQLTAGWLPAFHATVRLTVPYAVWLGAAYVTALAVIAVAARLLVRYARRPDALARRRRVLGGSLLHALLDVAHHAKRMTEDAKLAASPIERARLHYLIRLAARIAAREWAAALRTGVPQADRIIRDQGRAIAAAISRWERPAALAGAELPALSRAFAIAIVNAADNDWRALAGDATPVPSRHGRAWKVAGQALSLAVPLGAAAGIAFGIRPFPQTLSALLTFLVGLSIARVLRWLDLSADISPGLTVSELLRKPR